jgi:Phage terminase-like protein, large subunit
VGRKRDDPVTRYADEIVDGRIVAGKWVRLACERHLRDLETGALRGLRWDVAAAEHAINFFKFLRHSKGEWSGVRFELQPWQQFIVGSIFGWKRYDGTRRFRTAYNEIARKNGKSTLAAGVGLYLLVADSEPGAEIYAAATKRDQARIVWGEAARMVKASPVLKKRVQILESRSNMHVVETGSKFEALGADSDSMDGLNVHGGIVDELHAHKTRDVWDVLDTAKGARRQPLIFVITTAGTNRESVCYEQHEYSEQILQGTIQDDSYFAFIASVDDEDDPLNDESCWVKANPNLFVSVKIDELREQVKKAKAMPAQQNAVLRLRFNRWTQQVTRWIDLDLWDDNAGMVSEEKLAGRTCFGGLDLSSVSDLTAWVIVFPHDDDPEAIDVIARFWCPEARLHDDQNRYRAQYQAWAKQGFLKVTPGDAIDYSFVKKQILDDAAKFRIVDLNVDRLFQAHQLATELSEEGLTVVGMGQGFLSMAAPMKEFERRLLARKIHHGGNPVLRWMAGNVSVKQDPSGNLKPDKAQSQGKIDGIVALVMALDRAMRHEKPKRSVYEERGLRSL